MSEQSQIEAYKRVMQGIYNANFDLLAIAMRLAVNDPITFLQMAAESEAGTLRTFNVGGSSYRLNMDELIPLIQAGNKVNAIKWVRTKTNLGLKEAKCDIVDIVWDEEEKAGRIPASPPPAHPAKGTW